MKRLLISLILVCSLFSSRAQIPVRETSPSSFVNKIQRLMAEKNFYLPRFASKPTLRPSLSTFNGVDTVGALAYVPTETTIYMYVRNDLWIPITNFKNGLISGGHVSWTGAGLNFFVSGAVYIMQGIPYASNDTTITLSPADPSLPRLDVIGLDTLGVITITGTPASDPAKPQVEPEIELELTSILINAGATTPNGVTQEIIYNENTEWTVTTSNLTANADNTTLPYVGSKSIDVSSYSSSAGRTLIFTKGSLINMTQYSLLTLYVRLKADYPNNATIGVQFRTSSNISANISSTVTISNANYGFVRTNDGVYQTIQIPISAFTFSSLSFTRPPTEINRMTLTFNGAADGMYVDYINLQGGISLPSNGVISFNGRGGNVIPQKVDYAQWFLDTTYRRADSIFATKNGAEVFQWKLDSDSAETYQWSVIDSLSTPPTTVFEGDKYLVGTAPTGAFVGHANEIATYDGSIWTFETATTGDLLYNATLAVVDKFNGSTWARLVTPTNVNWWTRLNEFNVSGQFARIGVNTYSSLQPTATSYGYKTFLANPNGTAGSTAFGAYALHHNSALGYNNTAIGDRAMWYTNSGHDNVAVGKNAMSASGNVNYSIALGTNSVGENNTLAISSFVTKMRMYLDSAIGTPYSIVGVDALGNWRRFAPITGGSSYTFSNGLTESAGTVKLRGALTEGTHIWNNTFKYSYALSGTDSVVAQTNNTGFRVDRYKTGVANNLIVGEDMYFEVNNGSTQSAGLQFFNSFGSMATYFQDSRTVKTGLQYSSLDTTGWATSTLVTKDYINKRLSNRLTYNLINGGANIAGSGVGIFKDTSSNKLNFKRLKAGWNTKVTDGTDSVVISVDTTTQTLTDGATITFDANSGTSAQVTLGGNRTLAFSNFSAGVYLTLVIIQDGTGGRTITLPAGTKVINGGAGAVTLTTAASSQDILTFFKIGTTIYCNYGKNYN